jgi:hypothetical protein
MEVVKKREEAVQKVLDEANARHDTAKEREDMAHKKGEAGMKLLTMKTTMSDNNTH